MGRARDRTDPPLEAARSTETTRKRADSFESALFLCPVWSAVWPRALGRFDFPRLLNKMLSMVDRVVGSAVSAESAAHRQIFCGRADCLETLELDLRAEFRDEAKPHAVGHERVLVLKHSSDTIPQRLKALRRAIDFLIERAATATPKIEVEASSDNVELIEDSDESA